MRKKEEILRDCREDIQNDKDISYSADWLEYRKIEVLIDIRDQLANSLDTALTIQRAMQDDT